MQDRLLSFLGLCRRAKKLVIGAETTVESVESGKSQLVLYASDFSRGSLKKVLHAAERCGVEAMMLPRNKEELSIALGRLSGVLSVEDRGFADKLERYFDCYDREYFNDRCGLYVWIDDIMIGMDNDPASFGRPKSSTANIFLNSFMAEELARMAEYLTAIGRAERAACYLAKREALIAAIQAECWDARDQFFYSVDVDIKTRRFDWFHQGLGVFWKTLPIKVRVWSGFIPMWAGFATQAQAAALVRHMFDPATFESDYGVCTLAKDEKMFNLSATNNPSNWLGPIWLVANYVAFRGLMNYGYRDEAKVICARSARLLADDLAETGCMHEYYDPFTGKPIMNGGFINWNILALNMIRELEQP